LFNHICLINPWFQAYTGNITKPIWFINPWLFAHMFYTTCECLSTWFIKKLAWLYCLYNPYSSQIWWISSSPMWLVSKASQISKIHIDSLRSNHMKLAYEILFFLLCLGQVWHFPIKHIDISSKKFTILLQPHVFPN
jgi:hypothetical protein